MNKPTRKLTPEEQHYIIMCKARDYQALHFGDTPGIHPIYQETYTRKMVISK